MKTQIQLVLLATLLPLAAHAQVNSGSNGSDGAFNHSLSDAGYLQLVGAHTGHGLDFDDAYQFQIARENKLAIATQDKDFQRVRNLVDVRLL
jgi:hypothetical protein